jgi:outer membrane protein TolC
MQLLRAQRALVSARSSSLGANYERWIELAAEITFCFYLEEFQLL